MGLIVNPSKIKTIHNGSPDLRQPDQSFCTKRIKAVMVARFQDQKDHFTLFKSIRKIEAQYFTIDLIGDGPHETRYKELCEKWDLTNRVNFQGSRTDVPNFLNKSNVFILISNYEGLPLSICEAMSCGLPIIASDVGGVNEMVIEGVNGYLIPKGDDKTLSSRLNELQQNPNKLKILSEGSRKTYEEKFSIDKMVSLTESFYNQILKK